MSKDELFQGPPVELSVYKKVQESQISSIIDDIKEELHNILSDLFTKCKEVFCYIFS